MSTTKPENPPAFPDDRWQNGMTLRDYFAGQALAGMFAGGEAASTYEKMAHHAYSCADAMLAARQKEPTP